MRAPAKVICIALLAYISLPVYAYTPRHHHIHYKQNVYAADQAPSPDLATAINRIVYSVDPKMNVGIEIKSMRTGRILFTRNEQRSFIPASIMKTVTAEAALLYLGPNYTFATNFVTDAQYIKGGVLTGNIYLVHSGDPTLSAGDIKDMIATLRAKNIREISGNAYVDMSAYDQSYFGPGWMWDDKRFCFSAPISASIINHNCLSFSLAPAASPGYAARIYADPNYYYSSINNTVVTKAHAGNCYLKLSTGRDNSINIGGCMPAHSSSRSVSSVILDVPDYNVSLLRDELKRAGIRVDGSTNLGIARHGLAIIASHQSEPLQNIVKHMLKVSDNVYAGSLFKKLGETYTHQAGSWQNGGTSVLQILLAHTAINPANIHLIDGSGLSRENRISPQQIMSVLDFAYHDPKTNTPFYNALPIAGIDGTLKHRMLNLAPRVHAKTGTMSEVISLAGYTTLATKEPVAFVIIINRGPGWKPYKQMEDRIVTYLTRNYRG